MGRIKDFLMELAEALQEFVEDNPGVDKGDMREYMRMNLDEDEYPFYLQNEETVLKLVTDITGPLSENFHTKLDEDEYMMESINRFLKK